MNGVGVIWNGRRRRYIAQFWGYPVKGVAPAGGEKVVGYGCEGCMMGGW